MRRRWYGFTLIELLVVISIIALLVGILLPALGKARLAGQRAVDMSNQRQILIASHSYATDQNGYAPGMAPQFSAGDGGFWATWENDRFGAQMAGSGIWGMWKSGGGWPPPEAGSENTQMGLGVLLPKGPKARGNQGEPFLDYAHIDVFYTPRSQNARYTYEGQTYMHDWGKRAWFGDQLFNPWNGDGTAWNPWSDANYHYGSSYLYRGADYSVVVNVGEVIDGPYNEAGDDGAVAFPRDLIIKSWENVRTESYRWNGQHVLMTTTRALDPNVPGANVAKGDGSVTHHTDPDWINDVENNITKNWFGYPGWQWPTPSSRRFATLEYYLEN